MKLFGIRGALKSVNGTPPAGSFSPDANPDLRYTIRARDDGGRHDGFCIICVNDPYLDSASKASPLSLIDTVWRGHVRAHLLAQFAACLLYREYKKEHDQLVPPGQKMLDDDVSVDGGSEGDDSDADGEELDGGVSEYSPLTEMNSELAESSELTVGDDDAPPTGQWQGQGSGQGQWSGQGQHRPAGVLPADGARDVP